MAGAGVEYEINTRLVRGLDYYSRTVFEWTTNELGAQGTVCGGGRYDGLVEQIGGTPTPGVGFSMGIERLIELRDAQGQATKEPTPDAYLFGVGEVGSAQLHAIAETIRDAAPSVSIIVDAEPGRAKAKFRRADQSGAIAAIAVGESELEQGNATVKPLRGGDQTTIKVEAVGAYLATQRG